MLKQFITFCGEMQQFALKKFYIPHNFLYYITRNVKRLFLSRVHLRDPAKVDIMEACRMANFLQRNRFYENEKKEKP